MKLREKFLIVCGGCDGCGEYEEPIGGFENEITYKLTKCDCENGKELDWRKIDAHIKQVKIEIEEYQESISIKLELAKHYTIEKNKELLFSAMKHVVNHESKLLELEIYLEELEEIE
jgi:hypothetical protein